MVFQSSVYGYSADERRALASVFFDEDFEDFAKQIGVAPLSAFYSTDPISLSLQIDDLVERERLKSKLQPAKFFRPDDGLVSVVAIIAQLENPAGQILPLSANSKERLLKELREVEGALKLARTQRVNFYFDIEW